MSMWTIVAMQSCAAVLDMALRDMQDVQYRPNPAAYTVSAAAVAASTLSANCGAKSSENSEHSPCRRYIKSGDWRQERSIAVPHNSTMFQPHRRGFLTGRPRPKLLEWLKPPAGNQRPPSYSSERYYVEDYRTPATSDEPLPQRNAGRPREPTLSTGEMQGRAEAFGTGYHREPSGVRHGSFVEALRGTPSRSGQRDTHSSSERWECPGRTTDNFRTPDEAFRHHSSCKDCTLARRQEQGRGSRRPLSAQQDCGYERPHRGHGHGPCQCVTMVHTLTCAYYLPPIIPTLMYCLPYGSYAGPGWNPYVGAAWVPAAGYMLQSTSITSQTNHRPLSEGIQAPSHGGACYSSCRTGQSQQWRATHSLAQGVRMPGHYQSDYD
ncbi:hypothetical protein OH77DRAFT_105582 [Trametes cingulata]|nr:hypothetical protein OH77DRAFT_105582 [Trametes cingulata]